MKGRKQLRACDFNADQLVRLLHHLDQYDPDGWMIFNAPRDPDCWTDDYEFILCT